MPYDGSIPARAGEPTRRCWRECLPRVYPRACGGTGSSSHGFADRKGLSPRVRGNRSASGRVRFKSGSIPARAGEPPRTLSLAFRGQVYPRACGGTPAHRTLAEVYQGLSPRVRGNLAIEHCERSKYRSIPARAGEPRLPRTARTEPRVYPRACGGTPRRERQRIRPDGLSPRVRGNPLAMLDCDGPQGSIPARAGEPPRWPGPACSRRVYPRACGEPSLMP